MALTIGPPPTTAPALWKSLISLTRSWLCPLGSITFRLSEKTPIPHSFIHDIVDAHGASLRQLAMFDCEVDPTSIWLIASRCPSLERLAVYVPKKNLVRRLSAKMLLCERLSSEHILQFHRTKQESQNPQRCRRIAHDTRDPPLLDAFQCQTYHEIRSHHQEGCCRRQNLGSACVLPFYSGLVSHVASSTG